MLIDGEHYPPVTLEAIQAVKDKMGIEIIGACFLGGTEKIGSINDFKLEIPLFFADDYLSCIKKAINELKPDVAVDLSDEPVVGYEERMEIASLLAAHGVDYYGSDFQFKAPQYEVLEERPSLGIIGTGKRVGKTAVSAHTARLIKELGYRPVVVAMGRGGPQEPVFLNGEEILIDNNFLLELKKSGKHAASDYVEDAMMSRVLTIGCRRCGGGMLGVPFVSNVDKGVSIAKKLNVDIILLEGSGSAIPPVEADHYITVASLIEPESHLTGFLGPYRMFISSLLVLTNCENNDARKMAEKISKGVKQKNPGIKVAGTVFRPRALESLKSERVFMATTTMPEYAHRVKEHLEETENCEVTYISTSLSSRNRLLEELERKKHEFTAVATELKAAAVDVVLDFALKNDKRAVFFDNVPHTVFGDGKLEDVLTDIVKELIEKRRKKMS